MKKGISVSYSETQIPDTVIIVLQLEKATIILAGIYLSHRVRNKSQKLILILETVNKLIERYNDPTVLLFGDLNMNEQSLKRSINKLQHLLVNLKLRIVDSYTSPPSFPPLTTRKVVNNCSTPTFSRLDYILTNGNCSVTTEFVEGITDHIFFNVNLNIKNSSMRRVLSIDRNKIIRELSPLTKENIYSVLTYLKDNLHTYRKKRVPKLYNQYLREHQIPFNRNRLINEWISDYKTFTKSVASLRFTAFQGFAFNKLRSITKYDQFQRRDGSIINIIRDQDDNIRTNTDEVHKALIDHLRKNDDRFTERTYKVWTHIPHLTKPTSEDLITILSKVNQHKALTSFPFPDEYIRKILINDHAESIVELWSPSTLDQVPV